MPITITRRSGKEYLYFVKGAGEKLYLGTENQPNESNVQEAINALGAKIRKYEIEMLKLRSMLVTSEEYEFRYKMVVFDLDGVIFDKPWHEVGPGRAAVSTWNLLFQKIGQKDAHTRLKENFEKGIFPTYQKWTVEACNVLKAFRLEEKTFKQVIDSRPYVPGAAQVFKTLNDKGVLTGVVSGSFQALAERASRELGIDKYAAHCNLYFDKSGYLDKWDLYDTDYGDKAKFIKRLASEHGFTEKECVYVGDDVNDLDAFKTVGLAIAFNANRAEVRQKADVVIESPDLGSILPHLYIIDESSKKEFSHIST